MRILILITFILSFLSTQVLGSVAYDNVHKQQGDLHGLAHELGQPHSHDHEDESKFVVTYSAEALEHIEQDIDCCVTALVNTSPLDLADTQPTGAVTLYLKGIRNFWLIKCQRCKEENLSQRII